MAKRLSRERLFDINKLGEAASNTAGGAMKPSIGAQTKVRQGSLVVHDYQIDLANSTFACTSSATGVGGPGVGKGVKTIGATAQGGNAQIAQLTLAQHGVVAEFELVCLEAPTGGENKIGLWYGSTVTASVQDLGNTAATTAELITPVDQTLGLISNDLPDANLAGNYLYLVSSGSTADAYTAGKFLLRVYGYPVFDDV